eukprot:scaffold295635_cov71-Attheya_sp.AAC.3
MTMTMVVFLIYGCMVVHAEIKTIMKQVTFDMFAGLLFTAAASASLVESDIKVEVSILAAFLASIGSCITSHPGDVVLTATYQQSSSHDNNNLASVVSTIYKRGGIRAFFTGLSARFLHVGIIITSQLTRIQATPELIIGKLFNVVQATRRILPDEPEEGDDNDGGSILLGGLGPTVVGYGLEGLAKFGLVYETSLLTYYITRIDNNNNNGDGVK